MKNKFLMFSKTELAEYLLIIDDKSNRNNSLLTSNHFKKMAYIKLEKIHQLISENIKDREIIQNSKDMNKFERVTKFYNLENQYRNLNKEYDKWSKIAFQKPN
ncbi:MAG: hypothetical protein R3Y35_07410 [Clostridia bacterium]